MKMRSISTLLVKGMILVSFIYAGSVSPSVSMRFGDVLANDLPTPTTVLGLQVEVGDGVFAGIDSDAIHGNKSQGARQRALKRFRIGEIRVLVATDIAARGIDVNGITHVINYELPNEAENYVHRIGRTARAGANGMAFSFCDITEINYLRDIEKLIGSNIMVIGDEPTDVSHLQNKKINKPQGRKFNRSRKLRSQSKGHRKGHSKPNRNKNSPEASKTA